MESGISSGFWFAFFRWLITLSIILCARICMCLLLALLGLCCCAWAFPRRSEQEHRTALLCSAQTSHCSGFCSGCGAWAQLPYGMWNPAEAGIESMSSVFAGVFLTTREVHHLHYFLKFIAFFSFPEELSFFQLVSYSTIWNQVFLRLSFV